MLESNVNIKEMTWYNFSCEDKQHKAKYNYLEMWIMALFELQYSDRKTNFMKSLSRKKNTIHSYKNRFHKAKIEN